MKMRGAKINFLGDSITAGDGPSCIEARYVNLIASKYGAVCRNYGIGGTRIANHIDPNEQNMYFQTRVKGMDNDADAVVVFGGVNDYDHGDAPLGSMSDRTPDTFYGALHSLYTTLINKYPQANIVVVTPLHRVNDTSLRGGNNYKPVDVAPLKKYVEIIREVAQFYSLPVLDLYKISGLQPQLPIIKEKYMPDGLHPNDAGNRILADKIGKFLEQL